jgi:hypothetical protein
MAKDDKGRKYNRILAHTRVLKNGEKIKIKAHVRSNRNKKCKK